MTAGKYEPPPEGLIVVDRVAVEVAATIARDAAGQPPTEVLALMLTAEGHENGTETETTARLILTTAGGARLTGALLEALDRMRERSHTAPE